MKANLITYSLKKTTPKDKAKFFREFHGYTDKSNRGRYTYQRKGLIQEIPHLKPGKQTIIIPTKHTQKILKKLKKQAEAITITPITIAKKHLKQPKD